MLCIFITVEKNYRQYFSLAYYIKVLKIVDMIINKCNNYKKEKALNYPERILSKSFNKK